MSSNNPSDPNPYNGYHWYAEAYDALPLEVQEARKVLEKWFWRLEEGTADEYLPDPERLIDPAVVDRIIEEIEMEFMAEMYWIRNAGYDDTPRFDRLTASARQAMIQELRDVMQRGKHG